MMIALYRRYIREVLALAAPYAATDQQLEASVDALVSGPINLSLYRAALEWNLSQDYVRAKTNEDTDLREWRLTDLGKAKQEG